MTPTVIIKSMITTVATTMTSVVVTLPFWLVLVGIVLLLLLTGMAVVPSLWELLMGLVQTILIALSLRETLVGCILLTTVIVALLL